MTGMNRYILWQLLGPFLFAVAALTGVVWLTQSLRFLDLIINRGLSASMFFYVSVLLVPRILIHILPIALFLATVYVYHRLKNESELVVMRAAGLSPLRLALPAVALGLAVMVLSYALQLYVAPATYRIFKDVQSSIRNQYISSLIEEGTFNTIYNGLTIYVRDRDSAGDLLGIVVYDARVPAKPVTMMAERGALLQTREGPRFVMARGNRQEMDAAGTHVSILYFDRYTLDLSRISNPQAVRWRESGERFLGELFDPGTGADDRANTARFLVEAHSRLSAPLIALALALVAATCYLVGGYDRRLDWRRAGIAIAIVIAIEAASLGLAAAAAKSPMLVYAMYLVAAVPMALALALLVRGSGRRPHALAQAA